MDQQYITEETLQAFEITLTDQDKVSLLEHLNETLQERVGTEVATVLDDAKLEELITLQETASDEEMGAWLMQNVPELQQIVEDEIGIIMGEINEHTDSINKTA
jgi:hypothetical protein